MFKKNAEEWTRRVEIIKEESRGSRNSMHGCIGTCSRITRENLWTLGSQQMGLSFLTQQYPLRQEDKSSTFKEAKITIKARQCSTWLPQHSHYVSRLNPYQLLAAKQEPHQNAHLLMKNIETFSGEKKKSEEWACTLKHRSIMWLIHKKKRVTNGTAEIQITKIQQLTVHQAATTKWPEILMWHNC